MTTHKDEIVERLRHLRVVLKSGDYDGADLMSAWCAMMDAADLIEQQASTIERMGWRDIESAPKDGTAIWAATEYSGHGTGFMEPVRTRNHHYGEWTNIYTGNSLGWRPTHWMPLPEPPALTDKERMDG